MHRAGGVLLKHLTEHQLHCDVRAGDVVFYFTTCGWMMWNWLVSRSRPEPTIVLYDGSPIHPAPAVLFDLADRHGVTLLGVSAKFIDACARRAAARRRPTTRLAAHDLLDRLSAVAGGLRVRLRRGEGRRAPGVDLRRHRPVRLLRRRRSDPAGVAGEIQGPGSGWPSTCATRTASRSRPARGELVCTAPVPLDAAGVLGRRRRLVVPRRLLRAIPRRVGARRLRVVDRARRHGDPRPQRRHAQRRRRAHRHRRDLPQVEQLPEVARGLAVGQEWDDDTRIVLFVRLAEGTARRRVAGPDPHESARQLPPRHVPARIAKVADIPRTRSGKISELAVTDVVNGRAVRNTEALANPEALAQFRDRPELAS